MAKGGYRLYDLRGADLSSQSPTIPGIYDFIEGTIGKPILLTNFIYNGIEQNSCCLNFVSFGGIYQGLWTVDNNGSLYCFVVNQDNIINIQRIS